MSAEISDDFFLSVVVPRPIEGSFSYRVSPEIASSIRVGSWVKVPFGKSVLHGLVTEAPKRVSEASAEVRSFKLRDVLGVPDPDMVLSEEIFQLCKWVHDYYRAPLGEVVASAMSTEVLKKPTRPRKESPLETHAPFAYPLTAEQKEAFDLLDGWRRTEVKKGQPNVALLRGVTGSGKTELYIELAKKTLAEGKSVLVLVPEIALTPQLHERFEKGLGTKVGLWHSAVAAGQRRQQWISVSQGESRVIVGARSAVFAPLVNLGLIIVDEEHDPSYKQEERVRYHARDLAVVRSSLRGSFVVLGSATPSLETRERVLEGKYREAVLTQRVSGGHLPAIQIVDLTSEPRVEGVRAVFAEKTIQAIRDTLSAGQKVMIFLNRRGFAAFLVCEACGESPGCPQCSVSLTVHQKSKRLRCHVCGHSERIPNTCPKCAHEQLTPVGAGTESLEEELPRLIPEMIPIRLDRDQVTSTKRLKSILDEFRSGKANVLLGTQMLVKGHDFPEVTLVVVVLADALLRWPDFRATERAYQILTQVSGRAGRGEKAGLVMIQTYDVDHPVLLAVQGKLSESELLSTERELREALGYSPFGRMARLRLEGQTQAEAELRSRKVSAAIETYVDQQKIQILGPSEALLEKVKGRYRWDVLVKAKEVQSLQRAISAAKTVCLSEKWPLVVDVDPYSI